MIEKLSLGLQKLNIELSSKQIEMLELYINEVLEFNKSYNLMKAENQDEMAVNHILDSLAAVPHIKKIASTINSEKINIGDIGSGGGCPGIPLAIAFPQYSFTLVERMEKRCAFLETNVRKLKLENVHVYCTQADSVAKDSFDIEVFRAFHPFDKKIIKLLFGMLKPNGYLVAFKARSEKIEAEMEEIKMMVPSYNKIPLTIPFLEDHERNLVVIQKK